MGGERGQVVCAIMCTCMYSTGTSKGERGEGRERRRERGRGEMGRGERREMASVVGVLLSHNHHCIACSDNHRARAKSL